MENDIKQIAERLSEQEIISAIESILFVSADPIYFEELSRLFAISKCQLHDMLLNEELRCNEQGRGVTIIVTDETVQMVSNKKYDDFVVEYLQPSQTKSFSQSMIETLSIVAYRQPITRSEIDIIRGIRSEYSVTQLLKQGFITEVGRKDVLGRPMMFGTTDKFLRKFGLHSIEELPDFNQFCELSIDAENAMQE